MIPHFDNYHHMRFPVNVRPLIDTQAFEFHLTGERFLVYKAKWALGTDYQFFTECNPEVIKFLKAQGFVKIKTTCRRDPLLLKVYRKSCHDLFFYGYVPYVEVQLVKMPELKLKTQHNLRLIYPRGLPKDIDTQYEIWHLATQLTALSSLNAVVS